MCLPGKRENRENLLRERRRGGGDATDGERGGVTAEGEREREEGGGETSWFIWFSSQRRVTHSSQSDSHRALILSGRGGALTAGGFLWRRPQIRSRSENLRFQRLHSHVLRDMEISFIARAFPVSNGQILSRHF